MKLEILNSQEIKSCFNFKRLNFYGFYQLLNITIRWIGLITIRTTDPAGTDYNVEYFLTSGFNF